MRWAVIYQPKGAAREYSEWACNLVKSKPRKSCSHGCLYCYNEPGTEPGPILKDNFLEKFENDLPKLKEIIKPGERLSLTFVGDIFDPKLPDGVARKCIELCKRFEIPFQTLTKNGTLAVKHLDLYGINDLFGVTLTCDNDVDSLKWEPGASLWSDRIEALKEAHERGIKTWVSFEPVIDPTQTLHLIELVAPFADKIKVGKMNSKGSQYWHNEEIKWICQNADWEKFGNDAIVLLESLNKDYYIKDDLKKFLPIEKSHTKRAPKIQWENVPDELKNKKIWLVWRAVRTSDGKIDKIPWRPDGVGKLSWSNPLNRITFDEARELYLAGQDLPEKNGRHFAGVGFIVPERSDDTMGLAVCDLDDALVNDKISDGALDILHQIKSYSELSPSGHGIHIISLSGNLNGKSNLGRKDNQPLKYKGQNIEVFVRNHFVTFTGWRIDDYPIDVMDRTEEVCRIYSELVATKEPPKNNVTTTQEFSDYDQRARRYVEKALESEADLVRAAKRPTANSKGSRNNTLNAAALKIGRFVPKWIGADEVERTLLRAAISNQMEETEARATIKSGLKAGMKEKKDPELTDQKMSFSDAVLLVQDLKDPEKTKADPGMAFLPKYVEALAIVKKKDRAEYERARASLKKAGCSLRELKKTVEEKEAEKKEAIPEKPKDPPTPEGIHEQAVAILETGDPIKQIVDCCGRMVLGADKAFKKLTCCVAVQDVKQSSGLHPKLNGESGGGKTWVILSFAHHLPKEAVIKGSMSNKAGFYHKDGDRVLRILDDYQAGNEDLDTIIKQTSSTFHDKYQHRTVVNQEPVVLTIGSEQTWAITSVDSSQDIQVLNRQIPINVNDSECLTEAVNQKTIERYGKGEQQFPEDESVEVCREIWRILREDGYIDVRVPFWNRIKWIDTSNRRNPSIFMDLLIAHTAMNRFQREKDEDGYYLATEEDFHAAKALFTDKDAEELVKRLTRKEREFAEILLKNPNGLTRAEVAKALNVSINRITQLANGEAGKGGLAQKLPGFEIDETVDTIRLDDGDRSHSVRKTIYSLKGYNQLDGFDGVVKLLDEPAAADDSKPRKDGVRDSVRIDESKKTDRSRGGVEREERECKDSKEKERHKKTNFSSQEKVNNISLSYSEEKPYTEGKTIAETTKTDLTVNLTEPYRPKQKSTDTENETYTQLLDRIVARLRDMNQDITPFRIGLALRGNGVDLTLPEIESLMKQRGIWSTTTS